jgi:hypothetical protein
MTVSEPNLRKVGLLAGMAVLVGLNAVVGWMGLSSLRQTRTRCVAQAQSTAQNLALALENDLAGKLASIDLAVTSLQSELGQERRLGVQGSGELDAFARELLTHCPVLAFLGVVDADGVIVRGTGLGPDVRPSVADRTYFRVLRDNPHAGLVISEPVVGRVTGKWAVILARRIELTGGRFGGVVYGSVELDRLVSTLGKIDPGPLGMVSLRDGDLRLLARYPHTDTRADGPGSRNAAPETAMRIQGGALSGTFLARSRVDGVERTMSFRKVASFPLFVAVGLAGDDYLADLRKETRQAVAWFGLFLGSSLLVTAFLARSWRRDQRRIQSLRQALEEVRTLQDILPICMYCRKVRDDQNYWFQLEAYITRNTGAHFSHGVCPECRDKLLKDLSGETQVVGSREGTAP